MISAKLKIVGVTPEAVSRLHKVLKTSFELPGNLEFNTNGCPKTWPHAYIEESKFSPDYGTYTVSLSLNLSASCGENAGRPSHDQPNFMVHLSVKSLQQIFQAVDPSLLPDIEQPVPADEQSEKILREREVEKSKQKVRDEIFESYATLLYKALSCDIRTTNGRVLMAKGTDIQGSERDSIKHWNKTQPSFDSTGDYIDLESVKDKRVKDVLCRTRELQEKLDRKAA